MSGAGSGLPDSRVTPQVATAGPTADQREARRYVLGRRSGDVARLCRAAAGRRRHAVCASGAFEPLAGPTPKVGVPVIDGDVATVGVNRRQAPTLLLRLVRDRGGWGVVHVSGR